MQSTLTTECTHQSIESWKIAILGGKVIALKFILEKIEVGIPSVLCIDLVD